MNLTGNTILITGGTSGIGRALALRFLAAGNRVLICGRRAERLEELQREYPGLQGLRCDVTTQEGQEALLAWAQEQGVNILYNNAGVQRDVDFTRGLETLNPPRELTVNLDTVVMLTARFVPYLMTQPNAAVFTTTTGLIYMTSPRSNVALYLASKMAIHVFSVHLRRQLRESGVRVVETVPPIVDTEINPEGRAARKMASRGISADQFAGYVLEGMEQNLDTIFARDEDYPHPLALRGII